LIGFTLIAPSFLMITSLQNSLVKQVRKLHSAKERHQQELFLLEGTHLLEEALIAAYPLDAVCCTPHWQESHPQLWQQISNSEDYRVELVSDDVIRGMATTVQPDGVIAIAQRHNISKIIPFSGLLLALETIQDPGNLGTMIRTAVSAGVSGLYVSGGSVDLDNPKVLRASAGQWFKLPMAMGGDLVDTVKSAKNAGMQIVATLPTAKMTYWDVDWNQPSLILLGNEGAGLSSELAAMADLEVMIPLGGNVESLNVAIACALMLYEAKRQCRV
jgi:RNA methyltransferase, TrmH family